MSNQSILSEKMVKNLLHTLSADKKPYPQGLLDGRRAAYLSQVTMLAGNGPHLRKGNKQGRGQGSAAHVAAPMTPVMKAVLTVLIAGNIALASYLGVLVYENWDKVQAFLFGSAPIISETAPAPLEQSTQPPPPESTPEIVTAPESTDVPGSTAEPDTSIEEPQPAGGDSVDQPEASTPEPPAEDKPGLHLGQTPHAPDQPPSQDNNNDQSPDNSNDQGNNKNKDKDK